MYTMHAVGDDLNKSRPIPHRRRRNSSSDLDGLGQFFRLTNLGQQSLWDGFRLKFENLWPHGGQRVEQNAVLLPLRFSGYDNLSIRTLASG